MIGFKVIQPGLLSLIQDAGRFGQHHIGLTVGGPSDRDSFKWANRLCSNSENSAIIEITVGGLVLESSVETYFAVTGASIPLSINKVPHSTWTLHKVNIGDRIEIGFATVGSRCYLSVAGGFDIAPVFGSCSTVTRESIGGLHGDGRAIEAGDFLPCSSGLLAAPWCLPKEQRPVHVETAQSITVLRVILGYQQNYFTEQQKRLFFSSEYAVSERNDRMGSRLIGPSIKPSAGGLLSEGICLGAIQIPADGQPIVLLHDRQTIGGYPKIGSVLSLDLDKLTQLPTQSLVKFESISIEEAHNLLHLAKARQQRTRPIVDINLLSEQIEQLMVASNPRGMQTVSNAVQSGSYKRAAETIVACKETVFIGTGFPVKGTFETDGPVGAIALYHAIKRMGGNPIMVCDAPLAKLFEKSFTTQEIHFGLDETQSILERHNPSLIISIERPGQAADGRYYNMRGVDISKHCANFDRFMSLATCPTIAIGDGGNEIGMGNIGDALAKLDIQPSTTTCDELLLADISNWAAHGLLALVSVLAEEDLLSDWDNDAVLTFLSDGGSVDGVTGKNTLTEDSVASSVSQQLVKDLQTLSGF